MCGIAGLYDPTLSLHPADRRSAARAMGQALSHRGPDGEGFFDDDAMGLSFAHRRLAVIDPTDTGAQPMRAPFGPHVICFNGEIYNYQALGARLVQKGLNFDTHADTRVLLALIGDQGLDTALSATIGMFAFALADPGTKTLHLVRDRFGVKPLSYGRLGPVWLFASEVGAIEAAAQALGMDLPEIDPMSLAHMLAHGHVAEGTSIYRGFAKVPPGARVSFHGPDAPETILWFDPARDLDHAPIPPHDVFELLDATLERAVRHRLVADVPVGLFLSGGIDSSLVAAYAARQGAIKSFTVAFDAQDFNEAPHAQAVARHLGLDQHTLLVDGAAALALAPEVPSYFDEPFADASAIPTLAIARYARSEVTVALSGDGGDEAFGGYARHALAARLETSAPPVILRQAAGMALHALQPDLVDGVLGQLRPLLPRSLARRLSAARLAGLGAYWQGGEGRELYAAIMRQGPKPTSVLAQAAILAPPPWPGGPSLAEAMMNADLANYLTGDVLVKVDRATMAFGLEAREPLLDQNLVALARALPLSLKIAGAKGKIALRTILERHVPQALIDRPKQGFSVPLDSWLKGPLRGFAEERLAPANLARYGLFDAKAVGKLWQDHLSGRADRQHQLWPILSLIGWLERPRGRAA